MFNNKNEPFTYSERRNDIVADDLNQQYIYDNQILAVGVITIVSLIVGSFFLMR